MTVQERFLKYVSFPTMSDENSETCPSSEKQWALARYIEAELREMGLSDVTLDENGYITAVLPANAEGYPRAVGYIAHMDTSSEAADDPICPKIVAYEGGDILLNEAEGIVMREAVYPKMRRYVGQHLIVTDGKTLLGADDKAGLAEIVTAVENLKASGKPHGEIRIGFTPDEEIGRGADLFPLDRFPCEFGYTVDGGTLGEIEFENFNAASAKVVVNGVAIHPGDAKDRMKNAARIACEFHAKLPVDEIPERTSGYEGFSHLIAMEGETELAVLRYIIRDHDMAKFTEKKQRFVDIAAKMNAVYGDGTVELELRDSYYNMKEKVEPYPHIIERAEAAMSACGVDPIHVPIRGGTDGARLSYMGLPCPNLCTGGENFHSRFEFVSVEAMEKIVAVLEVLMCEACK
ncbi:MAG: peptidase T [Clostridia bacterium]|nr:peptidase T [Clostridia bacterium]